MPVQLIETMISNGGQQLKLARLARLPRLYRLIRILRMIKMLRVFRKSSQFKEWLNSLNISVGLIRMLNVLISMIFLVHLMACFWYMAATFEDNIYFTWVGHRDIVDASPNYKYFNAFYWAFQTVTTVGYGDFTISTTTEYILALIWMVIGVNVYSFTIGNVSSIIAAMDAKASVLTRKI
jgi:CRP-like cAMP-binding protein